MNGVTNPYFIRHDMNDTPGHNGGGWSSCPDIIFYTVPNPSYPPTLPTFLPAQCNTPGDFITDAGYAMDYGSNAVTNGDVNYVYLRALNTATSAAGTMPTRLWFMYTDSNLALWPQKWVGQNIQVGGKVGGQNWQDGANLTGGGPGQRLVTNQPFLWTPPAITDGGHYCCIAMSEPFSNADPAGSLSDPPFAPPSTIGYLSSWGELTNFVLTNDWFGWRNTTDVSSLGETWQQVIPVTGPDEAGAVNVGIQCTNMPTDGFVMATMSGPDDANSLNLPKTPITKPNYGFFVPVNFPASFKTEMVITYWQGATKPPYMSQIAPLLQQPNDVVAEMLQGRRPIRQMQRSPLFHPKTLEFLYWQHVYTIGGVPLRFEAKPAQLAGFVSVPRGIDEALAQGTANEGSPAWQQTIPVTGPNEAGRFYAGFQCSNMPTDGFVAALMVGPDQANTLCIPKTPISNPNLAMTVPLDWPANFETAMTITYWQGATVPPEGSSIAPVLEQPNEPGEAE